MEEQNKIFILDKYLLTFDSNIKHEEHKCEIIYGIKFYFDNNNYDIFNNMYMGNRMIINDENGWRDIPINDSSIELLPDCIKVSKL